MSEALEIARNHYGNLAKRLATMGLDEARRAMDEVGAAEPMPPTIRIRPDRIGGIPVEHLICTDPLPGCIFFVHGGGFLGGSIASHRSLAAKIGAAARREVVIIEYRLAPEHPFPAALDDVMTVINGAMVTGVARDGYLLCGDSAGGGLVISVVKRLQQQHRALPLGLMLLGPWVDLSVSGDSMTRNSQLDPMVTREGLLGSAQVFLGGHDPRDPLLSPIDNGLTGFPPMLVQVGSAEALLDDARALTARGERDGVAVRLQIWPDMMHTWHRYSDFLPEAQQALDALGSYADERFRQSIKNVVEKAK
jgi:monoterpene epsilon-lactone hydrolase